LNIPKPCFDHPEHLFGNWLTICNVLLSIYQFDVLNLVANRRRFANNLNIRTASLHDKQTTKKTKTEEMQEKATKQNNPRTQNHQCGQITDTLIPEIF
jgi:hypothetical protein